MSDSSIYNSGTPQTGLNRPATNPRPQSNAPQERGFPTRPPQAGQRNPLDLETAFNRLDQLLTRDAGTPRSDAPARGYYLNILA